LKGGKTDDVAKFILPDENDVEYFRKEDTGESYDSSIEDLGMIYWGARDYLVEYRGRYYLIAAYLDDENRIEMVSWITPEGMIRPLAQFDVSDSHISVVSADNENLCSGVARGVLKPVSLNSSKKKIPINHDQKNYTEECEKRYGRYVDEISAVTIDIDGDGTVENIGWFFDASPAGCGTNYSWLSVLTADCGRVKDNKLNKLLSSFHYCNEPLAIYKFKGNYFIKGCVEDTKGLFTIEKGKIKRVCGFDQITKTRMKCFYRLKKK
jgi:hypothetical protein